MRYWTRSIDYECEDWRAPWADWEYALDYAVDRAAYGPTHNAKLLLHGTRNMPKLATVMQRISL